MDTEIRKSKGYLYVAAPEAAPLLVYAQVHGAMAVPMAVRGDDRRYAGRAAAVSSAAEGAAPGLYLARVVARGPAFRVERGPMTADALAEIRRQEARALRAGRPANRALALARALAVHVLPVVAGCGLTVL